MVRKTETLQHLKVPVPEISLPSLLPSLLSRIGLSAYLWSMAHSSYKAQRNLGGCSGDLTATGRFSAHSSYPYPQHTNQMYWRLL